MKRLPRLDFLARVPPRRRAGWCLLGLGALALGMALALKAPRVGPAAPGQTSGQAAGEAPPPAGPAPPAGPPWERLFALEADHGHGAVILLALQPLGDPPRLRLQAQAADLAGMLAWLRQLEADPRLAQVTLLHHEWRPAMPAAPGTPGAAGTTPQVHFEVQALWRTGSSPG
ncbi:hypothetical protein [Sphaerotilus microaerophilus]|nr:hypothetical protein [Sphaerotilus sp. FB-5]